MRAKIRLGKSCIFVSFLCILLFMTNINAINIEINREENMVQNDDGPSYYEWNIVESVGEWFFDETIPKDNIVEDISGKSNHGYSYGTNWVSGHDGGYAMEFESELNSYVSVLDDDTLDFDDLETNQGFMIDFYMKNDKTTFIQTYVGLVSKVYHGGYRIGFSNEYKVGFSINNGQGDEGHKVVESNAVIDDNDWHHIVGVWSGEYLYIYIDEMSTPDNTVHVGPFQVKNVDKWLDIGNDWPTDNLNPFDGCIDDLRICKVELGDAKPKITYLQPSDNEILSSGNVTIWGKVDFLPDEIKKVQIKIIPADKLEEECDWINVYGKDVWVYTGFNTYDYPSGNLTIKAICYSTEGFASEIEEHKLFINNHNRLPSIIIEKPSRHEILSGEILIQGSYECFSNSEIELFQIKFLNSDDNWYDVYVEKNTNTWMYLWDSNIHESRSYTVLLRCKDNESYWARPVKFSIIIDHELPEINIIKPNDGYIYFGFLNIERYVRPGICQVFGKLNTVIEVKDYDHIHQENSGYIYLYCNDIKDPYLARKTRNGVFECDDWNYRCVFEPCMLKTQVISVNGNRVESVRLFDYFNLFRF